MERFGDQLGHCRSVRLPFHSVKTSRAASDMLYATRVAHSPATHAAAATTRPQRLI